MKHRSMTLAGLIVLLAACGGQPDQTPTTGGPAATGPEPAAREALPALATTERYAAGQLAGVVDTYVQENTGLDADFASLAGKQRQQQLELEQKYLAAVRAVDKRVLTAQDLLAYESFEQERLDAISVLEAGTDR